jgi:hypothetical protein
MNEADFRSELFTRLSHLERQNAAMQAMLGERCTMRGKELDVLGARVAELEVHEHKRQGRNALVAAGTGVLGGLLARFFPFGGGQ